jgi:hypothetical protein
MTADSMHRCHMYLVPLLSESFFIHATQIQTQIIVILQKYKTRELVNPQLLRKYIFF